MGYFTTKVWGAGSIIGRWMIEIFNTVAETIGYTTVIPMLNIVIALIIIAYSSIFLIRILKIDKEMYCYITSIIMVLSPALLQTFFMDLHHIFILIPLAFNFIFVMTNGGITYIDDRLSYSYVFYIIYPIFFINLAYGCHIRKGIKIVKLLKK